jgi:hypothetical protein
MATPHEILEKLNAMDANEFARFQKHFQRDETREWYANIVVTERDEYEVRICHRLGLKTEAQKLYDASVLGSHARAKGADAAVESARHGGISAEAATESARHAKRAIWIAVGALVFSFLSLICSIVSLIVAWMSRKP